MSVRQRTWTSGDEEKTAWLVDYRDLDGKRIQKKFDKKKDADEFHARVKVDVSDGTYVSTKLTVAQAGAKWIENAESGVGRIEPLERATIKGYREALKLHIVPLIGKLSLAGLNKDTVDRFEKQLIKDGRSKATVRTVLRALSMILKDAGAPRNAVRDRPQYKRTSRHDKPLEVGVDIPTPEQVSAIIHHAPAAWRSLLVVAAFTGLRASELRGLHWEDVNLKKGEIKVTRRADRYNEIGSPKSKTSRRKVPFGPIVANALAPMRLKSGGKGLVFPTREGTIVEHSNLVKQSIIPASRAAGCPQYTGLHCLRHFYASWCIDRKLDAKVIQTRMGHSSITMTYDRYGHLFPKAEDAVEVGAAEQAVMDATRMQQTTR